MKKALKITGIVLLGTGVTVAIVIAMFFPGLRTYILCKKTCPSLDIRLEVFSGYDITTPGETYLVQSEEFNAHLPQDCVLHTKSKWIEAYQNDDKTVTAAFFPLKNKSDFSLTDTTELSEEEAKNFFRLLGFDAPETLFDYLYIVHSIRKRPEINLTNLPQDFCRHAKMTTKAG